MRRPFDHHAAASVRIHLAHGINALHDAGERILHLVVAIQHATSREVGRKDVLTQLFRREVWIFDECDRGVGDLVQVMRRNIRCHTHGDTRRAVDKKVWQSRRQDARLLLRAVVVRRVVDRLMIDVGQHLAGDRRKARLGVAHRSGRVAVDRTKVSLPIDEWMAHGEILRKAHECVVECAVSVRVVLTHHLADDRGALAIGGSCGEAHLAHGVQDAAVYWLQPVANIRECARDDDAHCVVEIARPHLVFDADRLHPKFALLTHRSPIRQGSGPCGPQP